MIIKVIQEDIDKGKRSSAYSCPIALALQRVYGDNVGGVSLTGVTIQRHRYKLPHDVSCFISKFDRHGHGEPMEFEL